MNHIQFNKIILKNFLSFGNNPTEINFKGDHITAVLGINHDTGGEESRNGVGKSAIASALAYVLFGKSLRGISNPKLVNKLARKGQGMLVVLELDTPQGSYRIERGESPARMKLFRKDLDDTADILTRDGKNFVYDITRSKPETTKDIENILDLDIKLFEFLVYNSSESDSYMELPEDKKRDITERLMGLNILSQRAEELKVERKDHRKNLVSSESAIEATKQANRRIQSQIDDLITRERLWNTSQDSKITAVKTAISNMELIDLAEQKEVLSIIEEMEKDQNRINALKQNILLRLRNAEREVKDVDDAIVAADKIIDRLTKDREKLDASTCPTCMQHWVADPEYLKNISDEIGQNHGLILEASELKTGQQEIVDTVKKELDAICIKEAELVAVADELSGVDIKFDSLADLAAAGAKLDAKKQELVILEEQTNPHTDTIAGLKGQALVDVDDTEIRNLQRMVLHYDYLIDLLQSKDSFLRKAIIDQWLPKLNGRIGYYLNIMELPYLVRIENDLSMSITDFGEDFDWGNLSKGQRQRVTIAINLAFQDLYEATNQPLSLLVMDELLDNGLDTRGAERVLATIEASTKEKNKRVLLITHRADIADRVDDTMYVEMRNKISFIEQDDDITEMDEDDS